MHRCTNADSPGSTTSGHGDTIAIYRDELPGSYNATQLRHNEMNAIQEEIAYVIEEEGITLNTDSETASSGMDQLNQAIEAKLKASRIYNDSTDVNGLNVDDALNTLKAELFQLSRGMIDGLEMSVNSTDAYDLDVQAGNAIDSANGFILKLSSAITKQIDAAWAEGNNAGGFPSNGTSGLTLTNDTWYHVFLIAQSGGTGVDVGFDTNLDASVLLNDDNAGAESYDKYRRIGSIQYVDATTKIRPFVQNGDEFHWEGGSILDVNGVTPAATPSTTLHSLTLPSGVTIAALGNLQVLVDNSGSDGAFYVDLWGSSTGAPASADNGFFRAYIDKILEDGGTNYYGPDPVAQVRLLTDSAQIRSRGEAISGSLSEVSLYYRNYGYVDRRGKDS